MQKLPPFVELRAFEAAARHLSFRRAAAELGVTPTAISHQIRLLERYCGCALFRRRPRPVSLTEAGARLFPDYPRRARGLCDCHRRRQARRRPTASSRDDDERIREPLARAPPARLEEIASRGATGSDRHG